MSSTLGTFQHGQKDIFVLLYASKQWKTSIPCPPPPLHPALGIVQTVFNLAWFDVRLLLYSDVEVISQFSVNCDKILEKVNLVKQTGLLAYNQRFQSMVG